MAIDFRRMICRAASKLRLVYKLFGCSKYYRFVDVCTESGLLPLNCPSIDNRRFFKDDVPTERCSLHPFPVPPPPPKFKLCAETGRLATQWCPATVDADSVSDLALVCRRHRAPRPDSVPLLILYVCDFSSLAHNFSDVEISTFAKRLGRAGCDYLRTFSVWSWAKGREYILPYRRVDGLANWDDPEPEWDRQLARVQRIFGYYGVGICLNLFSQQADRYPWSPFRYNTDGLEGWRDASAKAMRRWRQFIDRINTAMGTEGNIIDFGNELFFPNEFAPTYQLDKWASAWVVPLADHLRARGVPPPNPFSASGMANRPEGAEGLGTGGAIYARLTKPDQANWPKSHTFWVHHGTCLPEHLDLLLHLNFGSWHHGVSDDGIGLANNIIPKEKQGLTESQDGRRSAHWTWRIKMVERAKAFLGGRLRCVEVMPMTLKRDIWHPDMLHQEEEVDVFWRIAEQVYGRDITRPGS